MAFPRSQRGSHDRNGCTARALSSLMRLNARLMSTWRRDGLSLVRSVRCAHSICALKEWRVLHVRRLQSAEQGNGEEPFIFTAYRQSV